MPYARKRTYNRSRRGVSRRGYNSRGYTRARKRVPRKRKTTRMRPRQQTVRIVIEQPGSGAVQRPELSNLVETTPRKARF